MKSLNRLATATVAVALSLGGACGGGGSGTPFVCGAPTYDVTGDWDVDEDSTSATPGCSDSITYTLTATQVGSDVTVTTDNGRSYTGTMCANQLFADVPFSYPEDGGTSTVHALTITFSSATHCTFSSTWSWTNGVDSCSGTASGSGDLF